MVHSEKAAEVTFSNIDRVVRLKLYVTGYYSTVQWFEMSAGNEEKYRMGNLKV